MPLIVHDDVEQAADMLRPMYALYFGGMGARGANFHHDVAVRMGYEAEAAQIQDALPRRQEGRGGGRRADEARRGARADRAADKIRHDLEAWRESSVTTLLIGGDAATVRQAAELVLG